MVLMNENFGEVADKLKDDGLVVVHGFSENSGIDIFSGLASEIGCQTSFFGQPQVMDIKPQKGFDPASSGGTAVFPLHTDLSFHATPPKYIAMFCIDPGEDGGLPIVSDGLQAYKDLSDVDQSKLGDLTVCFPAPSHVKNGGYTGPIITENNGTFTIRFNRKCLDEFDNESLERFYARVTEISQTVAVRPGTLMVYDNHRFLHGRTEIKAASGSNSKRHLLRTYIDEGPT